MQAVKKFLGFKENREFYALALAVAIPVAIQNLISSSFAFVDNIMLGGLGETYITAAGLANQITFVLMLLGFGVSSGISIFIAQFWGSRNMGKLKSVVSIGVNVMMGIAVLFFLGTFFAPEFIMGKMSADSMVVQLGAKYMKIISFTFFTYAASFPLLVGCRCIGRAKLVMYISAVSIILNTGLNYVLIYGKAGMPMLGIEGAAIATLVSKTFEMVVLIYAVKMQNPELIPAISDFFTIPKNLWKEVSAKALPVTLNELFWSLGTAFTTVIYAWISTDAASATIISRTVLSIFMVLSFGLGNAASVILGTVLGSGDVEKAKIYNAKFMVLNSILGLIIGVIVYFISAPLIKTFYNLEPHVEEMSILVMQVTGFICFIKFSNLIMITATFRAGGDTVFSMFLELFCIWGISVPVAYITGVVLGWPIHFVVLLVSLEELAKISIGLPRVISGKWARVLV